MDQLKEILENNFLPNGKISSNSLFPQFTSPISFSLIPEKEKKIEEVPSTVLKKFGLPTELKTKPEDIWKFIQDKNKRDYDAQLQAIQNELQNESQRKLEDLKFYYQLEL